jgi:hypothetical protein
VGAGVNELYAEAACDTNFMIRGLVVFALASACLWAADDPLDLLRQAHVAVDKGKFKEAVKLADDANMIWSANAAGHEADYADVLVTEALALLAPDFKHGFPGRDSEQVGILGVAICGSAGSRLGNTGSQRARPGDGAGFGVSAAEESPATGPAFARSARDAC